MRTYEEEQLARQAETIRALDINHPRVHRVIEAIGADISRHAFDGARWIAEYSKKPFCYLRYLRLAEGPTAHFTGEEAEAVLSVIGFPRITHKDYSAFAEARNLLCLGNRFPKH